MSTHSAHNLDDALSWLRDSTAVAPLILAGGTDLMVEFESGRTSSAHVLDIWAVDELRGISFDADRVRIGSLTTCAELCRNPLIAKHADILSAAAWEVGATQIRNRATIGGNLGTASPAADLNPVLFALDARVELVSTTGRTELPIDQFVTGYRQTTRRPDQLIESISIPAPRSVAEQRCFRKVGTRAAQSISKVVAALALELTHDRGAQHPTITSVRAAAGSVAASTIRLHEFEAKLTGAEAAPEILRNAARAAGELDAKPIDDVRSTERYRRSVLNRILLRMLTESTDRWSSEARGTP